MSFEYIDGLDGVLVATFAVSCAHRHGRIDHHVGEEVTVDGDHLCVEEDGREVSGWFLEECWNQSWRSCKRSLQYLYIIYIYIYEHVSIYKHNYLHFMKIYGEKKNK